MKLKHEFLLHTDGEDTFLIPSGSADFSGVGRGNKTLNDILECLQEDVTEDEIVKSIREKYDAPDGIIERDVKKVLDNLREIGALID